MLHFFSWEGLERRRHRSNEQPTHWYSIHKILFFPVLLQPSQSEIPSRWVNLIMALFEQLEASRFSFIQEETIELLRSLVPCYNSL